MSNSILFNTAGSIALAVNYEIQGPYTDKYLTKEAATTIRINAEFFVRVDNAVISVDTDTDLTPSDLDTGSSFTGTTTYYVYACHPTSGTVPVFKISLNSTYPDGFTADTSRKIGGFTTDGAAEIDSATVWDLRTVDVTISGVTNSMIPAREITKDKMAWIPSVNDIGIPGSMGFGVGIHPYTGLDDFSLMAGTEYLGDDNYGNYLYADGSVMVWIPRFYYKVDTDNTIHIASESDYASTADANAAGYALHRAFIDGNEEKRGFFVDKYQCSKQAWGAGYIASSIKNGLPISTSSLHNPIADLTACAGNYHYEAINAAHARDGVDGAVNSSSIFFVTSRFIYGALAILALAHAQASSSTTYCAWYDATYNFPKGNNNNALGDTNDATISYTSDGYSNCGKTGSGDPFEKTTHNGQACGVADLNGNMWEISLGMTCIAAGKAITGATQANPCVITAVGHGYSTGDQIMITGVVGMTELNSKLYTITVITADTFSLDGVDSTAYTAYTSGGTSTKGTWYVTDQDVAMKDYTSGNSLATDHWGSTGVAATMTAAAPALETSGGGVYAQRFGSSTNQVLASDTSGSGYLLGSMALPKDANAIDTSGTNEFGTDYYYQYVRNEMCLLSGGYWPDASDAGVFAANLANSRTISLDAVGFRLACYPV